MSVDKNLFIQNIKAKDTVSDIFRVKYVSVMQARDGRNYLNIVLSDATGDLEGRKWNGAHDVAEKISQGDYVHVTGKINQYQNRLQIIVDQINSVESSEIDEADFIMTAQEKPEKMFDDLLRIVDELDDYYIRESFLKVFCLKVKLQKD